MTSFAMRTARRSRHGSGQTTIERQFRRAVVVRLVAITAKGRLSD
jgi:hypothetical protein